MSPFIQAKAIRRADWLLGRSVFLICLALYTLTFSGLPDNPDAEVEFQTTSALVRNGELAIGGTPEAAGIIAFEREEGQRGFNVMEGAGERAGQFYSWFGVGQAYVAVPFYLAGTLAARFWPEYQELHSRSEPHYGVGRSEYFEHLLVGWRNPLLSAWTVWLIFISARRLGVARRSAFVAALAYGLTSFAWPQARSTLSDVQATFFVFFGLHLLLQVRESFARLRMPHVLTLLGFGTCLGAAFLTRVNSAPAIAVLLVASLLLFIRGSRRLGRPAAFWKLAAVAWLPAVLGLMLFLHTNRLRFGDAFETGYSAGVGEGFFAYPIHLGLAGILIAPGKGLLWLAPAILLAPFGIGRAHRGGSRLILATITGLALVVILPVAMTQTWHGAFTYGPRYVLPMLPALWLLVALGLEVVSRRSRGRMIVAVVLGCGLVTNLPGVLVDHATHLDLAQKAARIAWSDPDGEDEWHNDNAQRFDSIQWDLRFAAPWAHWRILRHRVAGLGDRFPVTEIFFLEDEAVLQLSHERDKGFRHMAWVDFHRRLGGAAWPAFLVCLALLGVGLVLGFRGFDPALE